MSNIGACHLTTDELSTKRNALDIQEILKLQLNDIGIGNIFLDNNAIVR